MDIKKDKKDKSSPNQNQKPIKEKYAQFYFVQIANGLKYLLQQGIIHRDMKHNNILLTQKRKLLKLADFGLAKLSKHNELSNTIC